MKPTIYKVYYQHGSKPYLAYIGRTKNGLTQRLRQHFTGHTLAKPLDVSGVAYVEYAEFDTVADMYVMEKMG